MFITISIILTLLSWPFFGPDMKNPSWGLVLFYVFFCVSFTPFLGIPLYRFVMKIF